MSVISEFRKGLIKENPLLRLVLGMCPALAVTTMAMNGVAMGLAVTAVLVGSNLVISLLRRFIPDQVRIPVFIVIIASFVTIIDMVMAGYFYELHKVLGLFIPLIVVNCIILGRAEAFASKNTVILSVADGLGITILPSPFQPALVMLLPPGAFLALGLLLGLMNKLQKAGEV
jgi:electron transport complex protein RnfE